MQNLSKGLCLLLLCGAVSANAGGRAHLDAFLEGLTTFEAKFEQSVLDTENNRTGQFQGVFMLQRPGRFRWDYVSPYEQSIIADGRDVWIIDADLEQITQRRQKSALKGTPAALLAENLDLESEFEVAEIGTRQDLEWLELTPRGEDSQFVRILLAFKDNSLLRMEMADKFGQVTRFRFFDSVRNAQLDPEVFKFEKPPAYELYVQ